MNLSIFAGPGAGSSFKIYFSTEARRRGCSKPASRPRAFAERDRSRWAPARINPSICCRSWLNPFPDQSSGAMLSRSFGLAPSVLMRTLAFGCRVVLDYESKCLIYSLPPLGEGLAMRARSVAPRFSKYRRVYPTQREFKTGICV